MPPSIGTGDVEKETLEVESKEEMKAEVAINGAEETSTASGPEAQNEDENAKNVDIPIEEIKNAEVPSIDILTLETEATEEIVAEIPAIETPAAEIPAAETIAVETPDVVTPHVETPAVEAPAVDAPAVEEPAVETPAVEAPAVETTAVEASAVETPAVETSAVEAPAVEAPAVETVTAETPVSENLVVETPAEEEPAVHTPAGESVTQTAAVIETSPARDSYQETKEEIEDSLEFIKAKLNPPEPPAKAKRASKEVSPAPVIIPLPVVVPNKPAEVLENGKESIVIESEPIIEKFATECIPPVRPERLKRNSRLNVPDWQPPKQNIFSYIFGCFKSQPSQ